MTKTTYKFYNHKLHRNGKMNDDLVLRTEVMSLIWAKHGLLMGNETTLGQKLAGAEKAMKIYHEMKAAILAELPLLDSKEVDGMIKHQLEYTSHK